MRKLTSSQISQKLKEKRGVRYDYSKVDYTDKKTKIEIICRAHGSFFQQYGGHYAGADCPKCKAEARAAERPVFKPKSPAEITESYRLRGLKRAEKRSKTILQRYKKIHGDRYDYSKHVYTKRGDLSTIICKKHGEFEMAPAGHLSGYGCNKCYQENRRSWTAESWKSMAVDAVSFDSFKVYILECWNKKERFFKIGMTFRRISDRFVGKTLPYNYRVVKIIENEDAKYIHKLEKDLHKLNKSSRYKPKINFGGSTECYSEPIKFIK